MARRSKPTRKAARDGKLTDMAAPANLRITITDVRRLGFCPAGIKALFEERGVRFAKFLKNGIAADEFLAKGGAHAERVVRHKVESEGLSRQGARKKAGRSRGR